MWRSNGPFSPSHGAGHGGQDFGSPSHPVHPTANASARVPPHQTTCSTTSSIRPTRSMTPVAPQTTPPGKRRLPEHLHSSQSTDFAPNPTLGADSTNSPPAPIRRQTAAHLRRGPRCVLERSPRKPIRSQDTRRDEQLTPLDPHRPPYILEQTSQSQHDVFYRPYAFFAVFWLLSPPHADSVFLKSRTREFVLRPLEEGAAHEVQHPHLHRAQDRAQGHRVRSGTKRKIGYVAGSLRRVA